MKVNGQEHDLILYTENLARVVNHKRTVDNISIQVHQCDVLAIIGPSGAGKSSFLRMINRLDLHEICGASQLDPQDRFDTLTGDRLDTWADGRDGSGWR